MIKIKICGITRLEDARACVDAGVDFIGFNFFNKSPRFIKPERAADIIKQLPASITSVALFVEPDNNQIDDVINITGIKTLQFHSPMFSPEFCKDYKDRGYIVIKAFAVKDKQSFKQLDSYDVDGYLLDTAHQSLYGGTGTSFDWDVLSSLDQVYLKDRKIFLSGGLNMDNIKEAIEYFRPFAVDICSGVEKCAGIKDASKIKQITESVKGF